MTIWDLMNSNKDKDFTAYDTDIDADPVECINFDYEDEKGDNYYDCLYEFYRRVEVDETPGYNSSDISAKFYDFAEKYSDVFEKVIDTWSDDPAADIVESLNAICAGGLSDRAFGVLKDSLRDLPVPSKES